MIFKTFRMWFLWLFVSYKNIEHSFWTIFFLTTSKTAIALMILLLERTFLSLFAQVYVGVTPANLPLWTACIESWRFFIFCFSKHHKWAKIVSKSQQNWKCNKMILNLYLKSKIETMQHKFPHKIFPTSKICIR